MNDSEKEIVFSDDERIRRAREYVERNKKRRKRRRIITLTSAAVLVAAIIWGICAAISSFGTHSGGSKEVIAAGKLKMPEWVDVQLIPKYLTARSGVSLEELNGIVVHYVGNPSTSAKNNRNYFASVGTQVCSHFVVGLDGEIIQCVPINEKAAASNNRNRDTISIEVCHPDESGKYNDKTYASLVKLTAWLCANLELTEEDVIRHHDVTGKMCPLYYVEHEDAWEQFRDDVGDAIYQYKYAEVTK